MDGGDYRRACHLALRRAARIALNGGDPGFEIVSGEADAESRAAQAAPLPMIDGVKHERACGLFGCPPPAVPTEETALKSTANERNKRVMSLEILLTRDAANGSANHYDAAEVVHAVENRACG